MGKEKNLTAATQSYQTRNFILKYESIIKMYNENHKHKGEGLRVEKKKQNNTQRK